MPVSFSVVSKKNPSNPSSPPKYYASIKSKGRSRLRKVAQRIGGISTVSSADTMATLEGLLEVIPQELADGHIVELGDLGSFRLSAKSEGAENAESVTARSITGVRVVFTPGKLFKQALAALEFEKE